MKYTIFLGSSFLHLKLSSLVEATVLRRDVIPQTIFESDPPSPLCVYGFLGGVEKTMRAIPGSSLSMLTQIGFNNILVWLGLTPGQVTPSALETDGDTAAELRLLTVNMTQLSTTQSDAEAFLSKNVQEVTVSAAAQEEQTEKEQAVKVFAGLDDLYNSVRSLARTLRTTALLQSTEDSDVSSAEGRLGDFYSAPWRALVNSYFLEAFIKQIVGQASIKGLSIALESPMVNLGDAACDAALWSRLGDDDWLTYTCTAITVVGQAVGCGDVEGPNCALYNVTGLEWSPPYNPICGKAADPFVNVTLPVEIRNRESSVNISKSEGYMTYRLVKAILDFQLYATVEGLCGMDINGKDLLPGWHSILQIGLAEPAVRAIQDTGATGLNTALVLSRNEVDNDLLVLIRGTSNDYEWEKNFRTQLAPLEKGYGYVHSGMLEMSLALMPEILKIIKESLATLDTSTSEDKTVRITLAGHSLGGGIANVMGLILIQENQLRLQNRLRIQVIGSASPRSMDREASEILKANARVRNWLVELDAVPKIPCNLSVGYPRCDSREAFGGHGEGLDFYADSINQVEISTAELSKIDARFGASTWGSIGLSINNGLQIDAQKLQIPAPLQVAANHACAYGCYLSKTFCLTEEQLDPGYLCDTCAWVAM